MNPSHVKYLLIGGGLASSSAAEAIRQLDPQGELMLVGLERISPYHRPPLSKDFLRRRSERRELFVKPSGWYVDQRIQLRTGIRASHLDAARRTVALENGEDVTFDKLLIATGMSALHLRIPGADLPNVYYLRTTDDADRLHHAIDKALAEGQKHHAGRGRAAVIGGGVLGVELAATLTQLGLGVDLFVSKAYPWFKFAGEQTGQFLTRHLETHGVKIHSGRPPVRLEGDGRVQQIVLERGEAVPCDMVVAAVGSVINRELLRSTPIVCEKAILVDSHCRTNIPDIYAAGDCAAIFDSRFGKHRMLDHWENAIVTGTLAGRNMAGETTAEYDAVNYFFSDVFDLKLSAWGEGRQVARRLIRGSIALESPDFVEIGIAPDGRVAQVLAINHKGEDEILKSLVSQRLQAEGEEESLKDPRIPLASLL